MRGQNPDRNIIDRALGWLSPGWQLKRMRSRSALQVMNSFYEAGQINRRTQEWNRSRGDANATQPVTLQRLRDTARQLVRDNGYARSAIRTIVDDVVGEGIKPTAQLQAWKDWSTTTAIDVEGRNDLAGLEQMVMRAVVESGECLVRRRIRSLSDRLPIPMQIQVLEADFIDSGKHQSLKDGGKIVRGVEFNARGQRTHYHLFKNHPGASTFSSTLSLGQSERVPARDYLHIYEGGRPGQVRDASWFSPVLIKFKDFDEFTDATLMKQKIASCLAVITTDSDGSTPRIGAEDEKNPLIDKLEPGLIANLPAGSDIQVVQPPSVRDYPDFVRVTLNEIAAGIGVTPEDLTGDYTGLPFSAARMSRLRHWLRVRGWRRRMIIPQFLNPLWDWAMTALEGTGQETAVNDGWTAPPLPFVEPDREGLAIIRNIRGGIQTFSEVLQERGQNPETFWKEYARDLDALDALGIVLDADARKMTQAGQAQFSNPFLGEPPDGPVDDPVDDPDEPDPLDPNPEPTDEEDEDLGAGNFLSVSEAAKRYNINPQTIRSWVRKGAIPHRRFGPAGQIRLLERDLFSFAAVTREPRYKR